MGLFKDKSKALERSFKDQSLFQVIKLCHYKKETEFPPKKWTWACDQLLKTNNWSAENFKKTHHHNESVFDSNMDVQY